MTYSKRALVASLLAAINPVALHAQDTTSPTDSSLPSNPSSMDQEQTAGTLGQISEETLPSNVTITTPDGRPLSPDLLKQVLALLKSDPVVRDALNRSVPSTVRRTVNNTDIVVTARRPRGSVLSDVPPARTLDSFDIRAYGARDISELVSGLDAEVASIDAGERKQPIVLLNGRRISSFDEIANYPTEAIQRLEVFPEDLALSYGYPANRKVVNVVTFDPFKAKNLFLAYGLPTDGGRTTIAANGRYLRLADSSRYNLNLGFDRSRRLLESERDIRGSAELLAQGRYRTLLPASRQLTINGSYSNQVFGGIPLTLTARASSVRTKSLFGLGAMGPLDQDVTEVAANGGATLSGQVPGLLWFSRANYSVTTRDTSTDSDASAGGRERARAATSVLSGDVSLSGSLLTLPAGPVSATLRTEYSRDVLTSRTVGVELDQPSRLLRNRGGAFLNMNIPLLTRSSTSGHGLGNFSVNVQGGLEQLSGFGTFVAYGYGTSWLPIEALRINASVSRQRTAPSLDQLGGPTIVTPNVRTFDYVSGETIDITQTIGANRTLRPDDRRVVNLGLLIRPAGRSVSLTANFVRTVIDDPIMAFPVITQPLQAAFPERFVRNSDGRLSSINRSPINLSQSRQSLMRWGINITRSLGELPGGADLIVSPTTDGSIPPGTLPPNSKVIENPPGTPLPPELENAISRVYLSFYHTWHLEDAVVLRDGGFMLDLLDGFALDGRRGRPRHEFEVSGGAFKRGIGARLSFRWEAASMLNNLPLRTDRTGARLRFSRAPLVDISLFMNREDRIIGTAPSWLKKLQLVFNITNILNARPVVRDEQGSTPLNYQAPYLDPLGRVINFSLRKLL